MKIFGDEARAMGRLYVGLPSLLLIVFLIGLFWLAASGQSRLNAANQRVHESQQRQQALSEFSALITDAESGQRGYLLTGESAYLLPYTEAVSRVEGALDGVQGAYVKDQANPQLRQLRLLTGKKLGELADTLALFKKRGTVPAVSVVRTDVGRRTMAAISAIVDAMRGREVQESAAASAEWRSDFRMSRWVTGVGALLNIGLVLLATGRVYGEMQRRARQATDLHDYSQELQRQVEERTTELTALSTHLQGVSEQEKSALSRELHDELGGLLVAARMDLSWLQQRLPTSDPAIEQRFKRIHESLSAGVDLKRRVVEELRPTLLDNMGLYAALRWQFKESCRRSGLLCTESIPEVEPSFDPDAAIGVFRIAQEAMINILKHAEATSADLTIGINGSNFVLKVSDDGRGLPANRVPKATSHGLASMRHRIAALGGNWSIGTAPGGGTTVTAVIPLGKMLAAEAA